MRTEEFNNILENDIRLIEKALLDSLPIARSGQESVVSAMKYSLMNGGKRLRPVLAIEFARCCGSDRSSCLPLACAVEYVHTYSLIHDDLPCMDDDDMRRGLPSCHKAYNESTALLAGDALLTHAFSIITATDALSSSQKANAVSLLSQNAGVIGMLGGQVIDLLFEREQATLKQILTVHKMKTGALISAACLLGCICGGATENQFAAASKFAYSLGAAFQIQDDILDVIGDEKKMGKPVGSDSKNKKNTYVSLAGIEKAKDDAKHLTLQAIDQLSLFENADFIKTLAFSLMDRDQ